ncbi:MerR family transcriptional regulator [Kitasatospora sp. GAS1066B]|uniref:helix-turn-helix domain-containing protein n=1 Tax=Kitasatospora sp. GAS1066B TaxID=3156271 RepID=UPI0035175AF5
MTMDQPRVFSIGMLAEAAGVSVKTVRYYSDQGLLPDTVERSAGGHRRYGADALEVLRTLRGMRALGLPLPLAGAVVRTELTLDQALAEQREEVARELTRLRWRAAALAAAETSEHLLLLGDALQEGPARDSFATFWRRVLPLRIPASLRTAIVDAALPELPADPTPRQALAYAELRALTVDRARAAEARYLEHSGCDATMVYQGVGEAYTLAAAEIARGATPAVGEAVDAFVSVFARAERKVDNTDFRRELAARRSGPEVMVRYWSLSSLLDPRPNMGAAHEWITAGLCGWAAQL